MKSQSSLTASMFLLLAVMSYAASTFAQLGSATLSGRVTDQGGLAVSGAKVEAVNVNTNALYPTETNEQGLYNIPSLLPGTYRISVGKQGFQQIIQSGIELHVADSVAVNFALTVGSVTQSITITGEVPLVNTTSSSLGDLVDENKMADLPLNGRNYVDLTLIQPGVTEDKAFRFEGGSAGKEFSSNGATPWSNNFTIDGAQMVNALGATSAGAAGTTLGVDGIKEFRILTTGISSEYGMTMGSQVVMISKGGSNQFHGDVFEYLRNSIFDARNFFDYGYLLPGGPRLPHLIRNDFGGSFGGPIKKDKTFFYGVYEGLRQKQGVTTIDSVPGAGCHGPAGAVVWNGLGAQPAGSIGPCSQLGVNPSGAGTNSVMIWPAIAPLLALYPSPNLPNNQFTYPSADPTTVDFGQMRIDHNFSASDMIFVRYTMDNEYLNTTVVQNGTAGNTPAYPHWRLGFPGRDQFLTISENHIFSPTVLNTARISVSRSSLQTLNVYPDGQFIGPQYSFVQGMPFGSLTVGNVSSPIGPLISKPGLNNQTIYTLGDDVYYTKGGHAFKFGTLMNRYYEAANSAAQADGQITFSSIATFLRGLPATYQSLESGSLVDRFYGYNTFGFYIQDDWRVASRLTLNLGFRYEFRTNIAELHGNTGYAVRNLVTDSTGTPGPIFTDPTYHNFSPRVGFAYDVTGKGKTSIHGAFGIYYDLANLGIEFREQQQGTPPLTAFNSVSNPTTSLVLPLQYTAATIGKSLATADYLARAPHSLEYNLTAEQQLPFSMGLSVSYVGLRGIDLWTRGEGNPVIPTSITNGVEFYGPSIPSCSGVVPSCRRNPNFTTAALDANFGNSWYNALQVNLIKRVGRGLEFQSAYTWGQALDDTENMSGDSGTTTGCQTGNDPLNRRTDKGPSCFDVTNNWRFNVLYHFPKMQGNGFASKFVNGWWIGNIVSVQSGYPFTPYLSANRSRSGVQAGAGSNGDRASVNTAASIAATFPSTCTSLPGQPAAGSNPCLYTPIPFNDKTVYTGNYSSWFNPAMFNLGTVGFLGNSGRDMLRGPGLREWDFSIVKDTAIRFPTEGGNVEFRAEFFNFLNTANFGIPNGSAFTGSTSDMGRYSELPLSVAGQISNTVTTSRQIQFALKLVF